MPILSSDRTFSRHFTRFGRFIDELRRYCEWLSDVLPLAVTVFPPVSPRSVVLTVQLRQRCTAQTVRERAQSTSREELAQTSGPDFICAQHPSILLRGNITVCVAITQLITNCLHVFFLFIPVLLSVFQGVVNELFSQFGCVQSVELRDHPASFQDSGPKLSRFFKPAAKRVSSLRCNTTSKPSLYLLCTVDFRSWFHLSCLCFVPSRVSKWATLCFKTLTV